MRIRADPDPQHWLRVLILIFYVFSWILIRRLADPVQDSGKMSDPDPVKMTWIRNTGLRAN